MISRVYSLPSLKRPSAGGVKIRNILNSFGEEALVFAQDGDRAFLSFLDGDLNIENNNADIEEIRSFLDFLKPKSVFSDIETLNALGLFEIKKANVLIKEEQRGEELPTNLPKSDQVYLMLKKGGFELPAFEFFATDFCRRLNKGTLKCFYCEDGLAITLNAEDYCLLNGIVSLKKGMGSYCLEGAARQNPNKKILVCSEDKVLDFYLKNSFTLLYEAGYWTEKK